MLLALLAVLPGMFAASTALLPSSFTMYAMTTATAGVLLDSPALVIAAAAVGIVWGWVVAAIAFVPFALWVLWRGPLQSAWSTAALAATATLAPLVVFDRLFYGTWTVSLWNFIRYNVVGGGDSALYGVEGPMFYLVNGALNLNGALLAALAAPLVLTAAVAVSRLAPGGLPLPAAPSTRLVVALAPAYVWLAAISALPHKEERFLYVVYPVLALAAAATLATVPWLVATVCHRVARVPRPVGQWAGRLVVGGQLVLVAVLSLSRYNCRVLGFAQCYTCCVVVVDLYLLYVARPQDGGVGARVWCADAGVPTAAGGTWHRCHARPPAASVCWHRVVPVSVFVLPARAVVPPAIHQKRV